MSLYAIKSEMLSLLEVVDAHGHESPEATAAFAEHLAGLTETFDAKADQYAALIRVCETRAAARKEEAERLKLLVQDDERLADRLREALMEAMIATQKTKVETPRFRLTIKKNGGKIPVLITDESALPVDYRVPKVTEVIDKDALRAALEAGTEVPGAALGERGQRLELK